MSPRDPNRIHEILETLEAVWQSHPDLRLGQIIVNASGPSDPFHVEDDVVMEGLRRWLS